MGDGDGARRPPVEQREGLQRGEPAGLLVVVEDGRCPLVVGRRPVVGYERRADMAARYG